MITVDDYFMGRNSDPRYSGEMTNEIVSNAQTWVKAANLALTVFYRDCPLAARRKIRSGWRPKEINDATPGAARNSNHMSGIGGDIEDFGGDADDAPDLAAWCVNTPGVLAAYGIWMEDPRCTPTWVHWQTVPPGSGRRFFIPNADWAQRLAGKQLTSGALG